MGIVAALGQFEQSVEQRKLAAEFAQTARFLALAALEGRPAAELAAQARAAERTLTILKSPVAVASTTSLSSLYDYRVAVGGFLGSLRGFSVFDSILPSTLQLPLHTRVAVVTSVVTGSKVPELSVKPVQAV